MRATSTMFFTVSLGVSCEIREEVAVEESVEGAKKTAKSKKGQGRKGKDGSSAAPF
jgi:hypothetical protein